MNDQSRSNQAQGQPEAEAPMDAAGSILQRRRLLRAVGASGAIAGVGLPFSAQATSRPHCKKAGSSHNYHPTASAVGSIIGSAEGTVPPIKGHKCSHYKDKSKWGSGWSNGHGCGLTYDKCANSGLISGTKLRFWEVFAITNPGSGPTFRQCADIIHNYPNSDEAHWLTALFNANKRLPFAYKNSQVVDLYKNINPLPGGSSTADLRDKALTLFRDYLSSEP